MPSRLSTLNNKSFILCRSQTVRFVCIISCDGYQAQLYGCLCVDFNLCWNQIRRTPLGQPPRENWLNGKRPRYPDYASFTRVFKWLNYANLYFRRLSKTTWKPNQRFVVADDPSACFKNHSNHVGLHRISCSGYWNIFADDIRFRYKIRWNI